ncbi:MAG: type II toxin-antitoxin system VapC family toxin [Caulobacter sp.]|jgi:predicted nucleic-acid-binding protein
MLAIDTNVLVRFLVADDADQHARAVAAISQGAWIATTVLLETEWVLRSYYRQPQTRIIEAFRGVSALPSVRLEHPERVSDALDAAERGLGIADALHRAAATTCDAFVTFDQDLIRAAARVGGVITRQP